MIGTEANSRVRFRWIRLIVFSVAEADNFVENEPICQMRERIYANTRVVLHCQYNSIAPAIERFSPEASSWTPVLIDAHLSRVPELLTHRSLPLGMKWNESPIKIPAKQRNAPVEAKARFQETRAPFSKLECELGEAGPPDRTRRIGTGPVVGDSLKIVFGLLLEGSALPSSRSRLVVNAISFGNIVIFEEHGLPGFFGAVDGFHQT